MGPLGDYYLSQTDANQLANSPCVDAGDPCETSYVDDANYTTRTDSEPDTSNVDMGYHYPDSGDYVNYLLITGVDVNDPNVTGIIEPNHPSPGSPDRQFAEVLLTATPNDVCFKVNKWTVNDSNILLDPNDPFSYYDANTYILTMDSNKEVTVEFERREEYFLDTYVVGGVGGTIKLFDSNDPNGWYCDGVDVNVIATPAFGYAVFGWTVDGSPVSLPAEPNVLKVTMDTDANRTVTVEFITAFVHLDFDIVPDPCSGNDNGEIIPPRGGNYLLGTDVNLIATPDLRYEVFEWKVDGNPIPLPLDPNLYTVKMTKDINVTVEFKKIQKYELTTSVAGGSGTVAPTAPPPVDYNAVSGAPIYYIGTTVTVTASPAIGWHIEDWNGTDDDSSKATTNSVVMNSNRDVTVAFAPGFPIGQIWVCDSDGTPYDGPFVTIQAAIDVAKSGFPGYEGNPGATPILPEIPAVPGDIILVADGVYSGAGNYDLDFSNNAAVKGMSGHVDLRFGVGGRIGDSKILTVRSENGPEKSIIDCQGAGPGRGFYFHSPVEDNNCVVEGFTIKNGSAAFGGGLNCEGISAPVIIDCNITGNSANSGGGVYFAGVADDDTTYTDMVDEAEAVADAAEDDPGLITDPNDPNYNVRPNPALINEAVAARIWADILGDIVGAVGTEDAPAPTIRNCKILNNATTGSPEDNGGGIFCTTNATPTIISTQISGNYGYSGGGLYSEEGGTVPTIINCLITGNTSVDIGGAICLYESPAIINLCTIAYNWGLDYGDVDALGNPIGPKGGIACREATPVITNCIIGRNGSTDPNIDDWGDGFTYGDDLYECEATYSCIENGDDGEGNTDLDPLWISGGLGDYYLFQEHFDQTKNSPCVDAGEQYILSDLQQPPADDGYNLSYDVTTSVESDPANKWDIGFTDMGYHYQFYYGPPIKYELTITVTGNGHVDYYKIGDCNNVSTVYSGANDVSYFRPATEIHLDAHPAPDHWGYWNGTDNDASFNTWNIVTMYSDKEVIVEFEPILRRKLHVPADYPLIQDAIDAAKYQDTIVLAAGGADNPYHTSVGYDIRDNKAITITSVDPNDPAIVAATVIEMEIPEAPTSGVTGPAFTFLNVGRDTVLNGITMRGFSHGAPDGLDGLLPLEPGENGYNNFGGTIYCGDASPTIKNCVITDADNWAGDGGDGMPATAEHPEGMAGGWPGATYGGGMAIFNYGDPNVVSNPLLINCTFNDCHVWGGNGGDGGDGYDFPPGPWGLGGRGGGWYYGTNSIWYNVPWPYAYQGIEYSEFTTRGDGSDFYDFYTKYTGLGGAVYVGPNCAPEFIDCTFTNNSCEGGLCGITGIDGMPMDHRQEPGLRWKIDSFGAAVFCADYSSVVFKNCTFSNNFTDPNRPIMDPNLPYDPVTNYDNDDIFVGFGGAVAFKDNADVTFENCTFTDNSADKGGAIFCTRSDSRINDCNFVDNSAQSGGGVLFAGGFGQISRSNFTGNEASGDVGRGGAICSLGANALISNCNISKNEADSSGGGVYISSKDADGNDLIIDGNTVFGYNKAVLLNCLITGNLAGVDGGGVSANWDSEPEIVNCTIADNIVTGVGYGGGVYGSYGSYTNIVDSIVWGNSAYYGPQIGIGITTSPSTVEVSDSDVQGAQSDAYVEDDCTLIWDPNNLYTDPFFVIGPFGDYYLSQTEVGDPNQAVDSPCVDAGSGSAISVGMSGYTTRTDELFDRGIVDMGYHHLITLEVEECRVVDLFLDHFINFKDFAVFAWWWLSDDCSGANGWCDGADVTFDGNVDWEDLEFYIGCWLVIDNDTPVPNPGEWAIEPYSSSPTSIGMAAKTTVDTWGGDVEYYFECVYGDCSDSGWQSDPNYTDSGLDPNTEYGYRVKAKDSRCGDISDLNCTFDPNDPNDPNAPNRTDWSDIRYAITSGEEEPLPDTTPPSPAPVISSYTATSSSITLSATTASDESGVQYYFEDFYAPAFNSGWIANPTWTDVNLAADTMYTYRVKARDMSPLYNETEWSPPFDANTPAEGEEPPELQAPVIVGANQVQVGNYWHHVITARATTEDPLYFKFVCLDVSIFSSAWVPRDGPAVDTFDHPVQPGVLPDATITRGGGVITYDIALGVSWNLWQWQVCGSNDPSGVPSLCSAPVGMPPPFQ